MMMAVTQQTETERKMKTKYLRTALNIKEAKSNFVKNYYRSANSSYVHR